MRETTKNTILIDYHDYMNFKNPRSKYRIPKKESLVLWYCQNPECEPMLRSLDYQKAELFIKTICRCVQDVEIDDGDDELFEETTENPIDDEVDTDDFDDNSLKEMLFDLLKDEAAVEKELAFIKEITSCDDDDPVYDPNSWDNKSVPNMWDNQFCGWVVSIGFNRADGKRCKYTDDMFEKVEAYLPADVQAWAINIVPDLIDSIVYPRINIFDVNMTDLQEWIKTTTREEQVQYLKACVDTGWIKP